MLNNPGRRDFLRNLAALTLALPLPSRLVALHRADDDEVICERLFAVAAEQHLAERAVGEVVVAMGSALVGVPYEARTLEQPGDERLVVNLRAFDCVTFVESTLALARCIRKAAPTFACFTAELQRIRYRNGILSGYPSRLHYFSDWIFDNQQKYIVEDITKDLGGLRHRKPINFMSTHPSAYAQLSDEKNLGAIKEIEQELRTRELFHIPKERVASVAGRIRNGDILAITTAVAGLDVSHTGLAQHHDGTLHYLHAPLSTGFVQLSDAPLDHYLKSFKNHTGIMVARPLEPV